MYGKTPFVPLAVIAILALLPLGRVALAQSGLDVGFDRPGQNLNSFDLSVPDPLICKKNCDATGACIAFTYVKPGVQKPNIARCWQKMSVPAAVKNDCCISGVKVPWGLVLAFRNLTNQTDFPDPKTLGIDSAKATSCDANGRGWQWYVALPLGLKPEIWRLPPGLVFNLNHNGRRGEERCWDNVPSAGPPFALDYDKRKVGNWGGRVGCKNINQYLNVCHGGDIGYSEHVGYYWLESTGAGFDEWSHVLTRVPPYAVIGLKHSENQPDKTLSWNGQQYDPANLSQPPPPGLIRMHGGDQGAGCDEGYYWYELNVGQPVWKPSCKTAVAAPDIRTPKTFPFAFFTTAPLQGGTMYYYGTITAPGELISLSNPDLGLGKAWTVLFPKPGYTTDNCTDPNATYKVSPGQSTTIYQGNSLRGGFFLGFCLTSSDATTLGGGWPGSWTLNITYK